MGDFPVTNFLPRCRWYYLLETQPQSHTATPLVRSNSYRLCHGLLGYPRTIFTDMCNSGNDLAKLKSQISRENLLLHLTAGHSRFHPLITSHEIHVADQLLNPILVAYSDSPANLYPRLTFLVSVSSPRR